MKPCRVALLLCILSLLALVGCGKSSTTPDLVIPDPMEFPSSPDLAMKNFQVAYETMSPARLESTTHPASFIVLQASTRSTFPDVGETLDRQEQRDIAARMFSKQDLVDPNGALVPAVQAIEFVTFQRVGAWTTSLPGDIIPNTECALYSMRAVFDRGQTNAPLETSGVIKFYVSRRDSTVGGATRPYCQIIGQVDLTNDARSGSSNKGYESSTWGTIHALFR